MVTVDSLNLSCPLTFAETYIEEKLQEQIPGFQLADFSDMLQTREGVSG